MKRPGASTPWLTLRRLGAVLFLLGALGAAFAWQAKVRARTAAPPTFAAMLPQGALLTIESPDFATLLSRWNSSAEARTWLAGDNYSVFANSRLFSRLADAQTQFFSTAFPANAPGAPSLLTQVAGAQSIFAWYNIGNLEFVYITRMPSAQALGSALLQQRSRFSRREAGGLAFYVRTSRDIPARTVAFATVPDPGGDLLVLSTREDLMAGSLALIAGRAEPSGSLAQEPWYAEATTAMPSGAPALHMVLNMDRLVPMPYFRSYWVQGNISDMARYRAAVSDLYTTPEAFREERILLPREPFEPASESLDLASLAARAPEEDVFDATATADPALAVAALEEKLLGRRQPNAQAAKEAPEAPAAPAQAGSITDLETRIDTPPPVSATFSSQALAAALKAAGFDALLTCSTAVPPTAAAPIWVPIHNAVVLHGTGTWNVAALQSALQQSLRGSLTTGTLGIDFRPVPGNPRVLALSGPRPLFLAVQGTLAFLADDQPLLLTLLDHPANSAGAPPPVASVPGAIRIAGFSHTAQRGPYARLTGLIDGTNTTPATPDTPATPAYFSQNLRSLSDAFARLDSERIVEARQGPSLRQTVTYRWRTP